MAEAAGQGTRILGRTGTTLLLATALALSGCGVFKKTDKARTPTIGERIPVLNYETGAQAEAELADLAVVVPPPEANAEWAQAGGSPAKTGGHLGLAETIAPVWSVSIGQGSTGTRRLNAAPVVAAGKVFTMDTVGVVRAFDAASGAPAWSVKLALADKNDHAAFGGGVAFADGRVVATTGQGIIAALDAGTGKELWRKTVSNPLRGAPTVAANRIFALTNDNQLFAFNAESGEALWNITGTTEVAGILGAAAPAVSQETVVVGFSSGELNALRAENGRTVWADQLARTGRSTAMAALSDIDASPVIDRGRVFAIGHGGRMVALELGTGQRAWERNFAGTSTPWVAGEFIFVVTEEGEVVCITRSQGKVRWVLQLDRYKNPKKKQDAYHWVGPVLAGDRLYVAGSAKKLVAISPYEGKTLATYKLDAPAYLPPVVANNIAYLLTDDGKLTAYR